MSRIKGVNAQRWVAEYLQAWWPLAEAVGSGRHGTDILNTPGVAWEVKTAAEFRPLTFVKQAHAFSGADLPIVVYIPVGCAERRIASALSIMPLSRQMGLLAEAGYTPQPDPVTRLP